MVKISLLLLFAFFLVGSPNGQRSPIKLSTQDELRTFLEKAPCDDNDRFEAVRKLFVEAGATEDTITVDKHKDVENLVVRKKGKTDEILVFGAHYDKLGKGCGTIDNWSGIVILAEIYKAIKNVETEKTLLFVAFGEEEIGLVGSSKFVNAIDKKELPKYCAMVNFDSFGRAAPQALGNVSSKKLVDLAEAISGEMKIPFGKAGVDVASSDSASFIRRKIPAITLHGLSNGWENILHTKKDTMESVEIVSVYLGYRHGLVMFSRLESSSCEAFRK